MTWPYFRQHLSKLSQLSQFPREIRQPQPIELETWIKQDKDIYESKIALVMVHIWFLGAACKIFTRPPVATSFNSGSNMLRWYSVSSTRGNSFCRTPSNFKNDPVLEKSDLLCLRVSFSQNFYFMICVAGSCRERIESEASPSERIGRLLISLVIDILHRGAERERDYFVNSWGSWDKA